MCNFHVVGLESIREYYIVGVGQFTGGLLTESANIPNDSNGRGDVFCIVH